MQPFFMPGYGRYLDFNVFFPRLHLLNLRQTRRCFCLRCSGMHRLIPTRRTGKNSSTWRRMTLTGSMWKVESWRKTCLTDGLMLKRTALMMQKHLPPGGRTSLQTAWLRPPRPAW